MKRTLVVVALACAVSGLQVAARQAATKVDLKNTQGQAIGTATLTPAERGGVAIALDVESLSPGDHAIHIHQNAKCEPPFATAGPHFNPENRKHGLENPDGPHAGDMSNFTVGADGRAKTTVTNAQVTLGPGPTSVFANGGTSLVIHAKADDMKTDPAGNAGDRIACGVIAMPVK
jgi:superoxide dismutase, Cu-Zn family